MKRLPLDTSSFRQIRQSGDLYVDKSPWIYRLITEGRCYFLSRPRRFGKSLTINTLKELFRGNKKLFEGLFIYDKWSFEPHPVIIFDFNGIGHENPQAFRKALGYHLKRSFSGSLLERLYRASPTVRKLADDLGKALYREDWEGVKEVLNQILAQIPYPLYEKADERFFHTVFYLTLCLIGYDAEAETLSPGGRGDMAVKMGSKAFILEFKARGSAAEALQQIEERGYARRFEGQGLEVIKVGVMFDPEAREVCEVAAQK